MGEAAVEALKAGGFTEEQAKAQAEALKSAQVCQIQDLVTKADFMAFRAETKGRLDRQDWMLSALIAINSAVLLKLLF